METNGGGSVQLGIGGWRSAAVDHPGTRKSTARLDAAESDTECRTNGGIGCDSCHVATLHSGASDVAALNRQTYHPYSDFLLHDMGSLGDGIEQGQASGREIRTAPLWGLRFIRQYLHDGRATTVDQAIQAHDGQARAARDRYNALDPQTKTKVLAFLGSL